MTALTAQHRLATYGTLAPGRKNNDRLNGLRGTWTTGTVTGHLIEAGWGAEQGYPAMRPDPDGDPIAVHVFHSADLPDHWARLDAFEGQEYQRVTVVVADGSGKAIDCSIYALSDSEGSTP